MEEANKHFLNQFKRREIKKDKITKEWAEIYRPIESIKDNWYSSMDLDISEEEWENTLKEVKTNSAPGVSKISYTLIKNADNRVQNIFRIFANRCIMEAKIPVKWKLAQLYPILKNKDWALS